MNEAVRAYEDGVASPEEIDRALRPGRLPDGRDRIDRVHRPRRRRHSLLRQRVPRGRARGTVREPG
ncbi:hypothetical protein D8S78_23505 [Natrialba swarupiae]|nr:hypothetical protein [Natrialba swarupiae]